MKRAVFAIFICLAALSPASAQLSVGVGIEFGGPDYYGPPPIYYGPPPGYLYEQPPTYYAPAPPPVVYAPAQIRSAVSPDVVFDNLEDAGYREFGAMAFRDGVYKLSAVNRHGELVALEVSALTGEVEIEKIVGPGTAGAPLVVPPSLAPPIHPSQAEPGSNPLVVY